MTYTQYGYWKDSRSDDIPALISAGYIPAVTFKDVCGEQVFYYYPANQIQQTNLLKEHNSLLKEQTILLRNICSSLNTLNEALKGKTIVSEPVASSKSST